MLRRAGGASAPNARDCARLQIYSSFTIAEPNRHAQRPLPTAPRQEGGDADSHLFARQEGDDSGAYFILRQESGDPGS